MAPRLRVLVLSADVGEGHLSAARAMAEGLGELGADVTTADGLRALGFTARHVIRDGYRFQLRWAPWTYSAMYRLGARSAGARAVGGLALSLAGRRRLARLVRRHDPEVVVSTHPAITCVLGRMRLRRRLRVPLCVTVTDLADYDFWSHRGADLHMVMHEQAIASVERVAGAGSAAVVRPLVARRFLDARDRAAARRALDLPYDGQVVAVSGGGWGVGDLGGATEEALSAGAAAVVAVAGRNEAAQRVLERRFAGDERVRVLGFTDRMPELLRASDALVHSTGGVTSLEALSCGCPMVAYGSTVGHIRVHNAAMERAGLISVAETRVQLRALLGRHLHGAANGEAASNGGGAVVGGRIADGGAGLRAAPDAAGLVAAAQRRVRPLPAWRLRLERGAALLACAAALTSGLATDEAYSVASRPLELRPLTHIATAGHRVALVVRTAPAGTAPLARALARHHVRASIALTTPPTAGVRRAIAAARDDVLPELGRGSGVRWLDTREALATAPRLGADRRYLAPPTGLGFGQYLLARSRDASPVSGQLLLDASRVPSSLPVLAAGDVIVVTARAAGATGAAGVARVAAMLRAEGLVVSPLSALFAPPAATAVTAGDVMRPTAAPSTTASPATIPGQPSGA